MSTLFADASSLPFTAMIFIIAAAIIGFFGIRMTHVSRNIAIHTGMGEAVMGAVFIGASTSLSGIIASVSAAYAGHAPLAVSNSLGGIAAQTLFLAFADIAYRRANLEHAAATAENLVMTAFLLILLSIHLVALAIPDIALFTVHPASIVLIGAYLFGVYLLNRAHEMPMWYPRRTRETRFEKEEKTKRKKVDTRGLWLTFLFYSAIVGASGWVLAQTGIHIAAITGLSEGIVGGVFTAVATSLPELVIAITAVRMGALTLALGDIVGGNAFDTLFIAMSDFAFSEGPIYASITAIEAFWLAITTLMSAILMMGLLQREKHGFANIGLESLLLIVVYFFGLGVIGIYM
jgi:cation:H+ antiporter